MSGPNYAQDTISAIIACGSVTGVTAVAPIAGGTFLQMRGLPASTGAAGQSIVKLGGAGTGSYEIHLSGDNAYQDGKDCEIRYTAVGAVPCAIRTVSWAAGVITVQISDLAVPAAIDSNFTFVITRLNVG